MGSNDKLALPFGPGNKQLTNKIVKTLGLEGTVLDIQPMFDPPKEPKTIKAAPLEPTDPERDAKDKAFRARLRRARKVSLDGTEETTSSTSLG